MNGAGIFPGPFARPACPQDALSSIPVEIRESSAGVN